MASKSKPQKPTGKHSNLVSASKYDVNGLRVLIPNQKGCKSLDLLECKSSISALKSFTRKVATYNQHVPELRDLKESDIEPKVRQYLLVIRSSFPHIVVSDEYGMARKNGRTNKRSFQGSMEPKTAAVIELNATLMNRLVDAYCILKAADSETNTRRFRNLHFRLSVTMAHELVHVYNLYLQYSSDEHTPPQITYGGYGDSVVGESGRYWEYKVLGGFVDMRQSPDGMEVVALRDNHREKCWRIKTVHPKNRFTELTSAIDWKNKFKDVFPAVAADQETKQLLLAQIVWLTGPKIMKTLMYNMSGQDLRGFALRPRTVLRQAHKS
ncbi:hypothetical protein C8A00DRAFT_43361 [Chaetomidium leptoderma]|uniref:Uncharacterized protein n=1 Tax=Chaetomidium leptoderma TaxID=669021 RepID=A0AAN6VLI8_9PEZI|nr:hypothetical protein C8A00DRAFT_43361 [Chaetomidium leptoderma]